MVANVGPGTATVMLDSGRDDVTNPGLPVIFMHLLPVLRFTDLLQLYLQLIHIRIQGCGIGVPFEGVDNQWKYPRAKPGRSSILRRRGICNYRTSSPMLSVTRTSLALAPVD